MKNFTALIFLILFSAFIFADDDKKEDWLSSGGEETLVKFESEPGEATVIVDGEVVCQATPCTKILTMGEHEIEMRKENYTPKVKKGKITEGRTIKYKLEADCAWLTVKGDEAEVFLDGEYLGEPPIENKVITFGEHKIDYSSPCYHEKSENFTVTNGEKKNIDLKLEPRESAIKVYAQDGKSNVVEAEVYVDGKKLGKAPGTFKVPLCSKRVVVKKGEMEYSEILSLPLLESSLKEKQVKTIQALLLQWSKRPKGNSSYTTYTWNDAVDYCKNLDEDGYSDWRLPNIDELRTLIVNNPYIENGGYCKISEKAGKLSSKDRTYDCYSYYEENPTKLGDKRGLGFWSSSILSDHPDSVWYMEFGRARIDSINRKCNESGCDHEVRCVR
ncbi:MAG: PEGA domain-containing protein [Treponema sp.]|nr:PEGA domain-containing protein [Treponema sp.]